MKGRSLRWAAYLIALATVGLAVALASRFGTDPGMIQSPLIGQEAPGFALETLAGDGVISLEEFRGDIVVVNFFASWCLECRREHDDFIAAANAFSGEDVQFIQITYLEDSEIALSYLDVAGTSPEIAYLADFQSRTAIAYGVFGIPETFFVDENGVVVGKIIGETDAVRLGATIDAMKRGETPGQLITGDTQSQPDS